MSANPPKQLAFQAPHPSEANEFNGWFDVGIGGAFQRAGVPCIVRHPLKSMLHAGAVLRRVGLVRNLKSSSKYAMFVTLSHVCEKKLFPSTYFSEIIPYMYDCWPPRYDEWIGLCRRHDFRIAFVSAKQSRDYLAARVPHVEFIWLPEACDGTTFLPGEPLVNRTIDVMDYGRKLKSYHTQIEEALRGDGKRHEHSNYSLTRSDFIRSLANAKISICFPRSITHPEYAIGVETVTQRYFECMASRSLVVGHCPSELEEVFGYNPIIPADLSQPGKQLLEILKTIGDYQRLVDRNYQSTLDLGTWDRRLPQVFSVLNERGYQRIPYS